MQNNTIITYFGHAMFLIESSEGLKVGIDPYNEQVKDTLPSLSADIVLVSHEHFDHSNTELFKDNPEIVNSPDRKTIKGIDIEGIRTYHDRSSGEERGQNIIFKFELDGISFAHMGDLGHQLSETQVKELEGINILMLPIGGTYTINYREAINLIQEIGPNIAIPMHYKQNDTKIEIDTIHNFLGEVKFYKELGNTIQINRKELPDHTEIWIPGSS